MTEQVRARKFRRLIVYSLAGLFFALLSIGLFVGLKPLLLPFILGAFLAYLFKPLANSFKGPWAIKYARAAAFLFIVGSSLYYGTKMIKESLPTGIQKIELKVRLQYRFNERYLAWMGLQDNDKGNFIYKSLGPELDPFKKKIVEYLRLTDEERKQFLVYHQQTETKNKTAAAGDEVVNEKADRYYQYYLANLKAAKIDIENLSKQAKDEAAAKSDTVVAGSTNSDLPKNGSQKSNLAALAYTLTNWIIFPLAFIFILLDRGQIIHFFMRLIPNRYFELTHAVIEKVDDALGKYIRGTIIQCSLVGLTLILGFYLCGIELKIAILIGVIGGITNAIPFVGAFIACVIGAIYSLIAENITPILPFINENNLMLAVIGVVAFANLLDNALYQPLVVGSAVNIHPLVVIIGVFGGSIMFGFAGLIFAIPAIVIFKVVTETFFQGLKDYRII